MKKFLKLCLVIFSLGFIVSIASCSNPTSNGDEPTVDPDGDEPIVNPDTGDSDQPGGDTQTFADYTIQVEAKNGKPLKDAIVTFRQDGVIKSRGVTESNGQYFAVLPASEYTVTVDVSALPGYSISSEDSTFTVTEDGTIYEENSAKVVQCDMSLITSSSLPSTLTYSLGDQVYDFTATDIDGKTQKLSEILEEKSFVMLNFWYVNCVWCRTEFPILQDTYGRLNSDFEILAIDAYSTDTLSDVSSYRNQFSPALSFPLIRSDNATSEEYYRPYANLISGYPTSVIIDRYGTIALIETGAITAQERMDGIVQMYASDTYVPTYNGTTTDEVEREEPESTEINSDELIASGLAPNAGFTTTFRKETRETDAIYSWPWVATTYEGVAAISPTNNHKNNSYSIVYFDVQMHKDQVLALDYKVSTEASADYFYVLVNGVIYTTITGINDSFETAYTYVANRDETVEVSFCFIKDAGDLQNYDDTVYINNIRLIDQSELPEGQGIVIEREASYGEVYNDIVGGLKYEYYVEPVLNPEDGYYHVGDINGPLLLATLSEVGTHFSDRSIYSYAYDGDLDALDESGVYTDLVIAYANYGINGYIMTPQGTLLSGYVPVTEELKETLQLFANYLGGYEGGHDEQWLEVCVYFDTYNTAAITDPVANLAPFNAQSLVVGEEITFTYVRSLIPMGYLVKFVPETSAVYRLSATNVNGGGYGSIAWLFDENDLDIHVVGSDQYLLRSYELDGNQGEAAPGGFELFEYLEQGKLYYFRASLDGTDALGTLSFTIDQLSSSMEFMVATSAAVYTFDDADEENFNPVISVIPHGLGTDGYYHPTHDGSVDTPYDLNRIIYADFLGTTRLFPSYSLSTLLDPYYKYQVTDIHGTPVKDENGDQVITTMYDFSYLIDKDGNTVGDKTEYITNLLENVTNETVNGAANPYYNPDFNNRNSKYYGLIPVDAELQYVLQCIVDQYSFYGVEYSWLRLCYYEYTVDSEHSFVGALPSITGQAGIV